MIGAFRLNAGSNSGGQAFQELTVEKATVHPDFDYSSYEYDYALLKLNSTATADPVPLDGDSVDLVAGYNDTKTHLFPIGFGITGVWNGDVSDVLRHVDVKFVPQETCAAYYANYFDYFPITDSRMCATDEGQGSC